jgi:hypothetical protein
MAISSAMGWVGASGNTSGRRNTAVLPKDPEKGLITSPPARHLTGTLAGTVDILNAAPSMLCGRSPAAPPCPPLALVSWPPRISERLAATDLAVSADSVRLLVRFRGRGSWVLLTYVAPSAVRPGVASASFPALRKSHRDAYCIAVLDFAATSLAYACVCAKLAGAAQVIRGVSVYACVRNLQAQRKSIPCCRIPHDDLAGEREDVRGQRITSLTPPRGRRSPAPAWPSGGNSRRRFRSNGRAG